MRFSEVAQETAILKKAAKPYRAVMLEAPKTTSVKETDLPIPDFGQVRIRLEGSGVCASNIPIWEGREWFGYPVSAGNPGHEGWGTIDAVGEGVESLKIGDRVTALSYNAYASHDLANEQETVKLPEFLDGKPFPGEPLGCAMNIFFRSDIRQGQTVAIVGSGFLGLLLVQLTKAAGARVIVVSRREFSLEKARENGADHTIAMDEHFKIINKVKELTDGKLCDRVIETTGKEWPLNLSIEITGERRKLIIAGFHQDGMRNINVQMLNWRGIDMISAHERDPQQYINGIKNAIRAIEIGRMDPFPLFTHYYSLEDSEEAFHCLVKRPEGFIKALILTDHKQ